MNLHLLSTYLKKWSFNDNRISFNYSFCLGEIYERNRIDMRIGSPVNLVNEILNNAFHRAKEVYYGDPEDKGRENQPGNNIILVNESEVKRKLNVYLSKIIKEFNMNKRSRGRTRMISTRSLDFYYNDFEFEPLEEDIKFFVHLNRGINKTSGDLWKNAIDDFTLALANRPNNIKANRYMALSLRKLGKFDEAIPYLLICTEHDDSADSMEALAGAYVYMHKYKEAEKTFTEIEKKFPDSLASKLGHAQVAYKMGKGFKKILDSIYKMEPEWLREKIISEWDYKLPDYCDNEECKWNAAAAARYLGFERPFDLTRKAFNGEVPSYFDSEKGTIRFVKQELEHWVEMANRYTLYSEKYKTYPDKITKAELDKSKLKKKRTKKEETESVKEAVA